MLTQQLYFLNRCFPVTGCPIMALSGNKPELSVKPGRVERNTS